MTANKLVKETEFLVIDFETLTPKGRPPVPIELGIQKVDGYKIDPSASISWLIQPPEGLHVTKLDTIQTGIKEGDLVGKPSVEQVIKRLNNYCMKNDYVFIAQNAKYEANILSNYTEKYPGIAKTNIIDTILMSKYVLPDLPNYGLDTLAHTLNLTIPEDRHRALADCILTANVYLRLLEIQSRKNEIIYLSELLRIAEIKTKYNQPVQLNIFDCLN